MTFKFLQPKTGDARPVNSSVPKADVGNTDTAYVDNELVRLARGGDIDAMEQLFGRHQKRVYNIALRMMGDETDAADATQEVFIRAYKSINQLASDAAFIGWLKTLALNICRDLLRRRGRVRIESLDAPVEMDDGGRTQIEIADWSNNPEKSLERKQIQESVQNAISSLSPDFREVVTLFYVDGASVEEIAQIVGSPVGTVKSRLSRSRAELKRKLEGYIRG